MTTPTPTNEELTDLLAEYRGPERFRAAWALGQLGDRARARALAAPGGQALAALSGPEAARAQRDLVEAAACLVEGQRRDGPNITTVALSGGPEDVLGAFRANLSRWLARLGVTLPPGGEADLLRHLAGAEAVDRFRRLHELVEGLRGRARQGGLTVLERSLAWDYPELVQEAGGRPTHELSFREFLAQRLLELSRDRHGAPAGGDLAAAYERLTGPDAEEMMAELGRLVAGPVAARAVGDLAGSAVLALLAGDPEPAPTRAAGGTRLSPTSVERFYKERRWDMLRDKLSQYPVLSELLEWAGLPEGWAEELLTRALREAPRQEQGRFRDLLLGCLDGLARERGTALARRPGEADWPALVERAVVRAVLAVEVAGEPEWARAFRRSARSAGASSLGELETAELPGGQARAAGFPRFKRNLLAQAHMALAQANESWGT